MSNVSVQAQTASVQRATSDTGFLAVRGTRDGALFQTDWLQAATMEGRTYMVNVGAFSTPIVGGGNGTILDLDQPECVISVPANIAILPFRIHVQTQQPLTAADNDESEILISIDRTQAWDTAGACTAETALNLRTDNPLSSSCTCKSAFTGDITTTPVLGLELARSVVVADVQGTAANALVTKHELLYEPLICPIIMGPAMLLVHFGGTVATSGFAQVCWAEFPTNMFT